MSLISFTEITNGSTGVAGQVNDPLNTIFDDYNGNIDQNNLADNAIVTSKITNLAVTTAKINDLAVTTGKINAAAVTADKLSTGAAQASVGTSQTTTSTTYADLSTVGPAVTVTVGANGILLVTISSFMSNSNANAFCEMSFELSGANTLSADDSRAVRFQMFAANTNGQYSYTILLTGLTPGSTTATAKYSVQTGGSGAGTGTFSNRRISVVPL